MIKWSDYTFGFHLAIRGYDEWMDDEDRPTLKSMLAFRLGKLYSEFVLPFPLKREHEYGITIHDGYGKIHYGWRNSTSWERYNPPKELNFNCPWQYDLVKHKLLYPNGEVYIDNSGKKFKDRIHWYDVLDAPQPLEGASVQVAEVYPFTDYDGATTTVIISGEYREWRMIWLKWCPFFAQKRRTIDFTFKKEVGRKKGSWKGGLCATSAEWKEGESMKDAFDRWYLNWNEK